MRYPSAKELAKLNRPGRYAVGHGAYLQISKWNTRAWVFRYRRSGKTHHVGLGSCQYVTLAEAREKAHAIRRRMVLDDIDPLAARRAKQRERLLASVHAKTFQTCALEYIAAHEAGWRGGRSREQWLESLKLHVFPKIGAMAVGEIDVAAVLSVLDPIAKRIPETASRIRSRIALILEWAAARDLRPIDNPARRPRLLPKRERRPKHFAAMPYQDVPALVPELRRCTEMSARALEFLILTAARPGEVLGARWSEIKGGTWTVPAERMKSGDEHRVPLNSRAVELLAGLPSEGEFVFVGKRGAKPYQKALVGLLKRMGHNVTAHGFRSSFRTWCDEQTAYPHHVVEAALAHRIPNAVERAYQRSDLFEKRRRLMQDWADFCALPARSGEVVTLRGA
jgi:integrase